MTLENLRSAVRFTVFKDSTNTNYGNTDLDRNLNLWYKTGITLAIQANGDWQVNGEIATTDIKAGDEREYLLPLDILRLNAVYIKYGDQTEYVKAKQRDIQNISVDPNSYPYQPSIPEFDLLEKSIIIYPPEETITAVDDGLKIYYQDKITELSSTADEPTLTEPFEKLLIAGAAHEYCLAAEKWDKARELARLIEMYKDEMKTYYANRSNTSPIMLEVEEENLY